MVHGRICRSENERDEFLRNLKIAPCPHCKMVGFLNRHGFVRGFQQGDVKNTTIRAQRVFCGNRNRAGGCGRTFSVWIADKVKRLSLGAGRRVRDQFLVRSLDLTSIDTLNRQFNHWVEHDYNATVHSTLGMKPIDRFGVDLSRIRFLSPSEDTDELFYAETTRSVKKDNTLSFRGDRYETPIDLRGKKIELRYERHRQGAVVVYEKGRRIGRARLLDAVANGMARRKDAS